MTDLTPRQTQILRLIQDAIAESGMPPTRAEIARTLGFKSPNAAEEHLRALQRKGVIDLIPGASRGIQLKDILREQLGLPLIGRVAAGRPILAEEHIETRYQIDPQLFQPQPHYLLKVRGMSMKNAGILDGDLVAVHRTPEVRNRQIVVARLENEVTVKRYRQEGAIVWLLPENTDFEPIRVDLKETPMIIEGVVVGVLRRGKMWMPREPASLADILADARVWKLKDAAAAPPRPVWSTGRSALDARLPGGGWPAASLVEVLIDDTGLGEVQLFLPALVQCQRRAGGEIPWLVWIAPPHEPYAPALAQQGIQLSRLLVVRPATAMEALWAAEQALSSGVVAAVLLWLKGTDDRWLRRLKLAAEAGGSLGVLFRPERHRFESSPAGLRLLMTRGEGGVRLELLKVQGGRSGSVDLDP